MGLKRCCTTPLESRFRPIRILRFLTCVTPSYNQNRFLLTVPYCSTVSCLRGLIQTSNVIQNGQVSVNFYVSHLRIRQYPAVEDVYHRLSLGEQA